MLRILYDHQIFSTQVFGGISRIFVELMSQFRVHRNLEFELGTMFSNNSHLADLRIGTTRPFLPAFDFRGKGRILYWLNQFRSEQFIRRSDYDVLHPTYYDPYFLRLANKKPFVLTIYDMIHERLHRDLSRASRTLLERKRVLAKRAKKIIAISHNTKADIVELLHIPPEKIAVTHLANSLVPPCHMEAGDEEVERYVLFVGSRGWYKNFETCVRAISQIMASDTELRLLCVGGGAFSATELSLQDELGIAERVQQRSATDLELARLYAGAQAFIFPSKYEGFGIPVLEAFACGCPVVLSSKTSLPEVAGDAAAYCDSESEASIRQALERVLCHRDVQAELRRRGHERLKEFSWRKTATETVAIYESVL